MYVYVFHPFIWHKNMNAALDLHSVHLPSVWAEQMNGSDSQRVIYFILILITHCCNVTHCGLFCNGLGALTATGEWCEG